MGSKSALRLALLFALLAPQACLQAAHAQQSTGSDADARSDDSAFDKLKRAAERVNVDEAKPGGSDNGMALRRLGPLKLLRNLIASPEYRATMMELRDALSSTLVAPKFDTADDVWAVTQSIGSIALFLGCEEEVLFADGKTRAAIDIYAQALQLGELAKRWCMPGVDVGGGIEVRALRPIARHLDQLSIHDCNYLYSLIRAQLKAPDPAIEGFRAQASLAGLEIDNGIQAITLTPDHPESDPDHYFWVMPPQERQAIVAMRENDPQRLAEFRNSAQQRLSSMYDSVAEAYSNYPDSKLPESVGSTANRLGLGDSIGRFVRVASDLGSPNSGIPMSGLLIQYAVMSRCQQQLLAVHAAILRWRWENGVVPKDLAALKLGPLAIDPFTRQSLIHTRLDDTHYALASAGPMRDSEENGGRATRRLLTLEGLHYGKN